MPMTSKNPSAAVERTHDVFISFSSRNIKTARLICQQLESHGIACWLADPNRGDIPPGAPWVKVLVRELKKSRMVLLIFSKDSNLSRHVHSEIGVAFKNMLDILPIRIQQENPEEELEYYLIHTQWFDFIPPPPPLDAAKMEELIGVVQQIIHEETHPVPRPIPGTPPQAVKVPLFSTWMLKPLFSWQPSFLESIPALEGALWTFLIMFLVFFVPLAVTHRLVGDLPPQSLGELFSLPSQFHYYYPDLNAVIFDMLLHPAAFATLVYFVLFLNSSGNQYLSNTSAGFIRVRSEERARAWINLANLLVLKVLPVVMAVIAFFYRRKVYIGYGMKEPLVFWASLAVGLSIYAYVALAINSSYLSLLLKPIRQTEASGEDDRQYSSDRAAMLVRLTFVFLYIILMILIEISVAWMMANHAVSPITDFIRWIVLVFGGIAIVTMSVKILWMFLPEIGPRTRVDQEFILKKIWSSLLLFILPAVLILLTIRVWLQVR